MSSYTYLLRFVTPIAALRQQIINFQQGVEVAICGNVAFCFLCVVLLRATERVQRVQHEFSNKVKNLALENLFQMHLFA